MLLLKTRRHIGRFIAFALSFSLVAAIFASQIANAAFVRELWPFYLGLLALTAWSLFQFAYILFAPARADVPV